jgi:hypothetical protein
MKRLHNGKMADCKVCTPDQKPKRRGQGFEPRIARKVRGLEGNLRRQMAEEIGEDELSKDHRFQIMQHYGLIAPRIDRRITKPNWMEAKVWKEIKQWFHNATKGLVYEPMRQPQSQSRKLYTHPSQTSLAARVRQSYKPRPISRPQA